MSTVQHTIQLYIHPDSGPIAPMSLDMNKIETDVMHLDVNIDRDQARVQAIINCIKGTFKNVQPEARQQEIRWLISRLNSVRMYDGIVLRLSGTIDADGPQPLPDYTQDMLRFKQEAQDLTTELQSITQERNTAAALKANLESTSKALSETHELQLERIRRLTSDLEEAEEIERRAVEENKWMRQQLQQLQQEKASLEARLEKALQEQQRAAGLQRVVAELRPQLAEARANEQKLQDTLRQCEENNGRLLQRVRQLYESTPTAEQTGPKSPYLD